VPWNCITSCMVFLSNSISFACWASSVLYNSAVCNLVFFMCVTYCIAVHGSHGEHSQHSVYRGGWCCAPTHLYVLLFLCALLLSISVSSSFVMCLMIKTLIFLAFYTSAHILHLSFMVTYFFLRWYSFCNAFCLTTVSLFVYLGRFLLYVSCTALSASLCFIMFCLCGLFSCHVCALRMICRSFTLWLRHLTTVQRLHTHARGSRNERQTNK